MRVHANFAEYAPFALLLMALAESLGPPHVLTHLVGLMLVAGRTLHAARLRPFADTANPQVQSVGGAAHVHGDGHRRTDVLLAVGALPAGLVQRSKPCSHAQRYPRARNAAVARLCT
ncbi:MAG: MAPEG family protein [Hyphomicrobium sp.]